MPVADKQKAHDLIDQMQPEQVQAAIPLLKSLLHNKMDDEPVTQEDIQRYREAQAALGQPERWISMDEMLAEFGMTIDDLPHKSEPSSRDSLA